MGNGASTSVKKVAIVKEGDDLSNSKPVWTRSNSDGCIVENLNTSKTKVDLLELQLFEYKELLKASELKQAESEGKATELEKQLAEVEGARFELVDRVSELEQQLESLQGLEGSEVRAQVDQELTLSNQEVEKLEMHIKLLEEQMTSMRSKFRKKLRAANTEVTEAKQDSSLKLYSLKDQVRQLEEENLKLTERLERAGTGTVVGSSRSESAGGEDSRTLLILELSGRLSAQEDQLLALQVDLQERERLVAELQDQLSQERSGSRAASRTGESRPPSGASRRLQGIRTSQEAAASAAGKDHPHRTGSGKSSSSRSSGSGRQEPPSSETVTNGEMDLLVSDQVEEMESDSELRFGREDPDKTAAVGRTVSADSGRKQRVDRARRRQSSSRERRHSGHDRSRDVPKGDDRGHGVNTRKPDSSLLGQGMEKAAKTRQRSSSRGKQKEILPVEGALTTVDLPQENTSNSLSGVVRREGSSRSGRDHKTRISSAGSQDSAFHENVDEGTRSAPSSAGSSRHRRRLQAAQQRAASMENVDKGGGTPPQGPSGGVEGRVDERGSGVGDAPSLASTRSTKASDQELDDLLQELMGEGSPPDTAPSRFGVSQDKIRSLLADNT